MNSYNNEFISVAVLNVVCSSYYVVGQQKVSLYTKRVLLWGEKRLSVGESVSART